MDKVKKGVRLEHISKIYQDPKTGKDFYAVKDVSLKIEKGDVFGIIGLSLEIIEQFFITYGIQGIQMTQRPQPPGFIFQSFLQHQVYPPVDPGIQLFSFAVQADTNNTESPVFGGVFP